MAIKEHQVFLSYSRLDDEAKADNGKGWVEHFKEALQRIYRERTNKKLEIFFDQAELINCTDWRLRLSKGIRSSRLFLAFISPNYIRSENCRWEWREYLRCAHYNSRGDDGLMKVYFAEAPGIPGSKYDTKADPYQLFVSEDVKDFLKEQDEEFRRKQLYLDKNELHPDHRAYFDLRHWNAEGPDYILHTAHPDFPLLQERLVSIVDHISYKLDRCLLATFITGNITAADSNFTGRYKELRDIHRLLSADKIGAVCAVNGMGGLGKTALALQYAHAYAEFYVAGGCWLVDCEGKTSWYEALKQVFKDRELERSGSDTFQLEWPEGTGHESDKLAFLFQQLKQYCQEHQQYITGLFTNQAEQLGKYYAIDIRPRILLIMDNVTETGFLSANQLNSIPKAEWLEVLVTSRLGKDSFGSFSQGYAPVEELQLLSLDDSVGIFRRYQRHEAYYRTGNYAQGIDEIARQLDGFTLAIVLVAAYLGADETIDPNDHLVQLQSKGLDKFSELAENEKVANAIVSPDLRRETDRIRQDKAIKAILEFSLGRLQDDKYALRIVHYAAYMHNEYIHIAWIDALLKKDFPELADPGRVDGDRLEQAWKKLLGLQLIRRKEVITSNNGAVVKPDYFKIHMIVSDALRSHYIDGAAGKKLLENFYTLLVDEPVTWLNNRLASILTNEDRITANKLLHYFIEAGLVMPKQIRQWTLFLHTFSYFDLKQLAHASFEQLAYYLHDKIIAIRAICQATDEVDKSLLLSGLYCKREGARIALELLEHSDWEYNGFKKEYEGVILLLNETISEFGQEFGELRRREINDLNAFELEAFNFPGSLWNDYFDTKFRMAINELKFDRFAASKGLLDDLIAEMAPLFPNEAAKAANTDFYYLFTLAKRQRANVQLMLGSGQEEADDYFDDLDTVKSAIARYATLGIHRIAAQSYYELGDKYISDRKFEEALSFLDLSEHEFKRSSGELSADQLTYWFLCIRMKRCICNAGLGSIGAGAYLKELETIIDVLTHQFTETSKLKFVHGHFPGVLLDNVTTFFVQPHIAKEEKIQAFDLVNTFGKMLMPYMLQEPMEWNAYIAFSINYAWIVQKFFDEDQFALDGLEKLWGQIPDEIKTAEKMPFAKLRQLMLVLLGILKLSHKGNDFLKFTFYLELYEKYIRILVAMQTGITGKYILQYNLFIEEYHYYMKIHQELVADMEIMAEAMRKSVSEMDEKLKALGINAPNDESGVPPAKERQPSLVKGGLPPPPNDSLLQRLLKWLSRLFVR